MRGEPGRASPTPSPAAECESYRGEASRSFPVSPPSFAALVARCLAGDDQARAQFCAEHLGLVQRAVTRKLARLGRVLPLQSDVEDIAHEVFERLLSNQCAALKRLREPRSAHAWLVSVAGNHTIDYIRKWSSRMRAAATAIEAAGSRDDQELIASDDPFRALVVREQAAHIARRLGQMAPRERLMLDLYYVQGLRYAEIAELLTLNINTVAARLRRAKAKLRTLMKADRHAFE